MLHEVTDVDTEKRQVRVKDIKGEKEIEFSYDWLVISTGASPVRPPLPGIGLNGVFTLRTLEDGIRIENFIKVESPKRVTIIGGEGAI